MNPELVEYESKGEEREFFFNGYDDGMDFLNIVRIIKKVISPEQLHYHGWENSEGYFIKEGIQITLRNDFTGNELVYKDTGNPDELDKVRKWVKQIWDALQKQIA